MKAQAIVTSQGRIVSLDIAVNYCHDMKLFKMSRRNIGQAGKILADSGYQGPMNIFAKVKTFKMISTTYRNHRKRFGLRMNLIAGIINHELGF
ncbi:transposase [Streptococcus pneumoniae]|nr:transposase [Streptococcus pneumoniae]VLT06044.1 transposase [Streptococcus pneumoniae]